MPTQAQQRTAALAELELHCQPDIQPTLSDAELSAIIDSVQRASIWVAATAYTYGAVVLPTVRNGHRYRCTQAGTSAATESTWPTSTGGVLTEGASNPQLAWIEDGPDYENVFDIRAAIHQAWMLKASKASISVDVTQQVGGLRASQIYDHCVAQAERFAPVGMA